MFGLAIGVAAWYALELRVDGATVDPLGPTWAPLMFGRRVELRFDRRNYGELLEALAAEWTPPCEWEKPCHRGSCSRCRRRWLFATARAR